MTDHAEFATTFRVEHRLPFGSPRVLGEAPSMKTARDIAVRWRHLLRRLGGTGIVAVVNVATGTAVAVVQIDRSPW
jgi:hypothetical protein